MFDPVLDTVPPLRKILVCGTGKVSRAAAIALIEDLYDDDDDNVYLGVILSENQSDAALHVGEWAVDFNYRMYAYRLSTKKLNSRQQALWLGAEENCHCDKATDLLKRITKDDIVCVAYDENDKETMRIIATMLNAGITVKDLTMGLADVVISEDPEDDEEDEISGDDFPTVWVEEAASSAQSSEEDDFRAFKRKLQEAANEIIAASIRDYRRKTGGKRSRENSRAD